MKSSKNKTEIDDIQPKTLKEIKSVILWSREEETCRR